MANNEVGIYFRAYDKATGPIMGLGRGLGTLQRHLVGLGAGYLSLRGLSRGLQDVTQEAMSFETTIAKVHTMLEGRQPLTMQRYGRGITELSTNFGESTQTLGKGLYDILSASVAPSKALNVLAVAAKAAKAGITDTAVSADFLTSVLNAYGKSADEAGKISDQAFAIIKRGKLEYADLAGSIGKVAAVAATAQVSFEEVGAGIATLTRAGLQSDIAVTALRGIISSFISPATEAKKAAAEFGLQLDATTLATVGLSGVLEKLKKANAEQLAQIVPESRAFTGLAAAIRNASGFADDYRAILHSAGSTQEAFDKIVETSAFRAATLRERWNAVKVELGTPIARTAITALEDFARGLERIGAALDVVGNPSMVSESVHQRLRDAQIERMTPEQIQQMGAAGSPWLQAWQSQTATGRQQRQEAWDEGFDNTLREMRRARQEKWTETYPQMGWLNRMFAAPGRIAGGADEWTQSAEWRVKQFERQQEEEKRFAAERARAYRSMSSDLDSTTVQSWDLRKQLLDDERTEYGRFIDDKHLLDTWYAEQREKMAIAESQATGSFFDGFRAGIAEMERELPTLGQLGAGVADDLRGGFRDIFKDAVRGGRELESLLLNLGNRLLDRGLDFVFDNLFTTTMGRMFPMTPRAAGGRVTPGRVYWTGERGPEPFIPDTAGTILPAGSSLAPQITLNVTNTGTAKSVRTTKPQFDGTAYVVGVILDDLDHGGPISERIG